jgi:leucyl/phenylalanyl-tRNA--protein transferase
VLGGDLEPGTLLAAYRSGCFPMPAGRRDLAWFSPDPRAVLPPHGVHVSRTLRRSLHRFDISVDRCFEDVVRACGDPARPHGWIDERIVAAYSELHRLGWAHSVEVWLDGVLAGGLYGVAIGALFAAESKFHRVTDASKTAVVAADRLAASVDSSLFDVQWSTPHLATLGVLEVSRRTYLADLAVAVAAVGPDWEPGEFTGADLI